MDDMYRTIQQACKQAIKAHTKEQRTHVIFREMGLWRIKPVEEIAMISQKSIYGWTISSRKVRLLPGESFQEAEQRAQPSAIVRKQFYKGDCYYNPANVSGIQLYDCYTQQEIHYCLLHGQPVL